MQQTSQPALPFDPVSGPRSREIPVRGTTPYETRREGKAHADRTLGGLRARMQALYELHDRTDAELAAILHVRESTISARRHELPAVVKAGYSRKNPRTGISNSVWRLKEER